MTSTPRETVLALLGNRDVAAVGRFFGPSAADTARLRELAELLAAADDLTVTIHRVITEGDRVAVHASYDGFGPAPLVALDVVRVEDGRIVEHRDAVTPLAPPNPSGRSQVDGPVAVLDQGLTAANRALVTRFVETILIGGQYDQLPDFIGGERYAQHNAGIADGLSGLGEALAALAAQGLAMVYSGLHQVVAEGNFVLTWSEGTFGDAPMTYADLFRVEAGRIVEHWDVMQPIPPTQARVLSPAGN